MRTALFLALALPLLAVGCESTHESWDVPDGIASCGEVLGCMQACTNFACITACEGTICRANSAVLDDLMGCVQSLCPGSCASFSDPGCLTCVSGSCGSSSGACMTAACE